MAGAGLRGPLLVGSGVLLVGAGILAGVDQVARENALERTPLSDSERDQRQAVVNVLGGATVATGTVGVAVGLGAFLVGRW